MHPRTTLLLLLLAAALGAVILGVERYFPSTRELHEMRRGPVKFDRRAVTRIELDSSGGDGASLALVDNLWRVTRPFEDLADPERIVKLIGEVPGIGWIQRVHAAEFDDTGWAKTQLEQPRHRLRFFAGDKRILELGLGAPAPIDGASYVSVWQVGRTDETAYYVARTALPELVKAKPAEWRDGKLLRLAAGRITGLKLGQNGGQIELARKDENHPWLLVKPLSSRASKEKAGELLSTLLNLEITEVLEAGAAAEPTEAPGTQLRLTVTDADGTAHELVLSKPAKDATETRATSSHRKPVFVVRSKSLQELWSQPNDLRDRMLARIDEDRATSIRIESLLFPEIVLEKRADSWFLSRNDRQVAANGERILRFFEALNTHAIAEFTSDSAANLGPYGLDKPFLKVAWQEAGAQPQQLLFGKNAEGSEFFAKYEGEPSVYRIEASLLPSIPQDAIKWKGLGALRFSQFALRSIRITAGTAPPILLKYDPTTAQWSGERAGRDITPLIDRVKADLLAGRLAKFNVQDWSADASAAIHALQTPALEVAVTLGEPGRNDGPTRETKLIFAPTQEGMDTALYFGRVDAGPDVFYVARTSLLQLLAPVFKSAE